MSNMHCRRTPLQSSAIHLIGLWLKLLSRKAGTSDSVLVTTRELEFSAAHGTVVSMLIGTGVDLVEVDRIAQSIERYGDRFLRRVYTDKEIAYCTRKRNSAESFAARFAAKEAGAKALGTGINNGVGWHDIAVGRLPGGRPELELFGAAKRRAEKLGVRTISLSLTHTSQVAVAMVVMED